MIEDTSQRDPMVHLMGALSGGYIEGMEAAGQQQVVTSDLLPTRAPWDALQALGFVPGDEIPGDALFRHCALPAGWRREGSDHSMWSYIVDERGVRRVAIFYKAAFYDRDAFASIQNVGHAFSTEAIYGDGPAELPAQWDVLTEDERNDFRVSLKEYVSEAAPSRLERAPRVHRILKLAGGAA